jgi:hypothetical protein
LTRYPASVFRLVVVPPSGYGHTMRRHLAAFLLFLAGCRWAAADFPSRVIGNRRSHVYRRPPCPGAARMGQGNRNAFASAGEAEEAGYRRAGDRRP